MQFLSLPVCLLDARRLEDPSEGDSSHGLLAVAELGTGCGTCGNESFRNPDGMQDRSVSVLSLDRMSAVCISEKEKLLPDRSSAAAHGTGLGIFFSALHFTLGAHTLKPKA